MSRKDVIIKDIDIDIWKKLKAISKDKRQRISKTIEDAINLLVKSENESERR